MKSAGSAELAPLASHPIVGDIRVASAMVGIELVADAETKEPLPFDAVVAIVDELKARHHILVRDYGPTLVVGPPLILERDQVTRTAAALADVISRS